jgi:hypothetical protein
MTKINKSLLEGDLYPQLGPGTRSGIHLEPAVQQLDSFFETDQPQTRAQVRLFRIKSNAMIGDAQFDGQAIANQCHLSALARKPGQPR